MKIITGLSLVLTLTVAGLVTAAPAAALETVATFAADCATPKTVFQLGDTVCAKVASVAGGDLGNIWLQWVAPSGVVAFGSTVTTLVTTSPQNFTQALPTTGAGAERGLWKAQTANVSDSAARVAANFRVPRQTVIGVHRDSTSTSFTRNTNTTGFGEGSVVFGQVAGDVRLWGNWFGTGRYTPGFYRPSDGTFHFATSNVSPTDDVNFQFGPSGGQPLAGDWTGDGTTKIGVFLNGVVNLRNTLTAGPADTTFAYGQAGDQAFAGDFDGDGIATIGVYRDNGSGVGVVFLRNSNTTGIADTFFFYGLLGDMPVSGNWTAAANGMSTIGVYRQSEGTYYLRNSNDTGVADATIPFGTVTDKPAPTVHNEAPVVGASGTLNYTEGQAATAIDPAVTVTDMDNATLVGATAQITGNCASGQDVLSFAAQNGITGNYTFGTCLMTLTGQSSVTNYQTALRDVKYNNSSVTPSTLARTVTWQVNDGALVNNLSAAGVTSTINVTSSNSAPVLTAGGGFTYTEGNPATAVDITVNVTDADSPNLQSATVQITTNCSAGQDVLSFTNTATITASGGGCNLSLSGTDTVANWVTALRTVKYNNTSNAPSTAARTVTWQVNDGTDPSNTATSTITVVSVNSVPQLTAGGTLNYTENQAATAIDTTVTVTDADSPNLTGATVQITGNCSSLEDVLSFANTVNITGTAGSCSMTLAGTDTVANYITALRNVKYSNNSENPSGLTRTVTWQVNDGTDPSNTATSTINVTPVNDAPVGVIDRAHAVTGNVRIQVPVGANSLLNGVTDPEGNALTAQVDGSSTHVGNITINADGSYIYNPKAGRTGADVVKYKVCDNGTPASACSAIKNLTFNVADMLWFIDNSLGAAGDGRLTSPFNSIAGFTGINDGGADHPAAGQVIFIDRNVATDYTGPLTLLNTQKVLGKGGTVGLASFAGITLAPDSDPLPSTSGTAPNITTSVAATNAVNVVSGNTLRGFNVGNTTGSKISGTGIGTLTTSEMTLSGSGQALNLTTGTLSGSLTGTTSTSGTNNVLLSGVGTSGTYDLGSGALSGATSDALSISGGGGSFTYSGSISNGNTLGVNIASKTAGTVTLSGDINPAAAAKGISVTSNTGGTINFSGANKKISAGTGNGVNLVTNAGATINFTNGGLVIDTTSGVGFNATGGGSVGVSGTGNTITTTTGTALNLNGTGGTIGLDSVTTAGGGSGAAHILLGSVTGPVTITGGSLAGAAAGIRAIDISAGSANITYGGTINGGGVRAINRTGTSTVLISGTSKVLNTGATNAVEFTGNNATTTLTFSGGGLDIDTTTGVGFNATSGVVNVTGTNNTINSVSATALNVSSSTIGASGLTFLSISSGNNTAAGDPVNGIVLNTTGASGGLTVQGDGGGSSNGSGGTIQHTTGDGILLTSTTNVSLNYLNVQSNLGSGIHGTGVTNFTLTRCNVTSNGDSTADDGLRLGEPSGAVVGVTGTVAISNCDISGNAHNNVHVRNTSGTIASFTVTTSSFNNLNDTFGANAFLFEGSGTSSLTVGSITGSTFSNNSPQRALEIQAHDTATVGTFTVSGNTFSNNGIHASFTQDGSANLTFKFLNHGALATPMTGTVLQAVNVFSSSQATGGTIVGTISNNHINNGTTSASGIAVVIQGQTDATLLIDGNRIRSTPDARGIAVAFRGPANPLAGTLGANTVVSDLTLTNNDVDPGAAPSGFPLSAIMIEADNQTGADNKAPTVRADVRGNIVPAGTAFDLLSTYLGYYEYDAAGGHGIGQLVDTGAASANATAQLTENNTGSASAFGVSLIAGPINTPP